MDFKDPKNMRKNNLPSSSLPKVLPHLQGSSLYWANCTDNNKRRTLQVEYYTRMTLLTFSPIIGAGKGDITHLTFNLYQEFKYAGVFGHASHWPAMHVPCYAETKKEKKKKKKIKGLYFLKIKNT